MFFIYAGYAAGGFSAYPVYTTGDSAFAYLANYLHAANWPGGYSGYSYPGFWQYSCPPQRYCSSMFSCGDGGGDAPGFSYGFWCGPAGFMSYMGYGPPCYCGWNPYGYNSFNNFEYDPDYYEKRTGRRGGSGGDAEESPSSSKSSGSAASNAAASGASGATGAGKAPAASAVQPATPLSKDPAVASLRDFIAKGQGNGLSGVDIDDAKRTITFRPYKKFGAMTDPKKRLEYAELLSGFFVDEGNRSKLTGLISDVRKGQSGVKFITGHTGDELAGDAGDFKKIYAWLEGWHPSNAVSQGLDVLGSPPHIRYFAEKYGAGDGSAVDKPRLGISKNAAGAHEIKITYSKDPQPIDQRTGDAILAELKEIIKKGNSKIFLFDTEITKATNLKGFQAIIAEKFKVAPTGGGSGAKGGGTGSGGDAEYKTALEGLLEKHKVSGKRDEYVTYFMAQKERPSLADAEAQIQGMRAVEEAEGILVDFVGTETDARMTLAMSGSPATETLVEEDKLEELDRKLSSLLQRAEGVPLPRSVNDLPAFGDWRARYNTVVSKANERRPIATLASLSGQVGKKLRSIREKKEKVVAYRKALEDHWSAKVKEKGLEGDVADIGNALDDICKSSVPLEEAKKMLSGWADAMAAAATVRALAACLKGFGVGAGNERLAEDIKTRVATSEHTGKLARLLELMEKLKDLKLPADVQKYPSAWQDRIGRIKGQASRFMEPLLAHEADIKLGLYGSRATALYRDIDRQVRDKIVLPADGPGPRELTFGGKKFVRVSGIGQYFKDNEHQFVVLGDEASPEYVDELISRFNASGGKEEAWAYLEYEQGGQTYRILCEYGEKPVCKKREACSEEDAVQADEFVFAGILGKKGVKTARMIFDHNHPMPARNAEDFTRSLTLLPISEQDIRASILAARAWAVKRKYKGDLEWRIISPYGVYTFKVERELASANQKKFDKYLKAALAQYRAFLGDGGIKGTETEYAKAASFTAREGAKEVPFTTCSFRYYDGQEKTDEVVQRYLKTDDLSERAGGMVTQVCSILTGVPPENINEENIKAAGRMLDGGYEGWSDERISQISGLLSGEKGLVASLSATSESLPPLKAGIEELISKGEDGAQYKVIMEEILARTKIIMRFIEENNARFTEVDRRLTAEISKRAEAKPIASR